MIPALYILPLAPVNQGSEALRKVSLPFGSSYGPSARGTCQEISSPPLSLLMSPPFARPDPNGITSGPRTLLRPPGVPLTTLPPSLLQAIGQHRHMIGQAVSAEGLFRSVIDLLSTPSGLASPQLRYSLYRWAARVEGGEEGGL